MELDDVMSRLARGSARDASIAEHDWRPAANISETPSEYLIRADLPAVKKEDIHIAVQDGVITISGERHHEKLHDEERLHRVETYHGSFLRSFRLPEDVDSDGIHAAQNNGVLIVHIPKAEPKRPQAIRIDIR